jgi:hypothetical protein
MPYTYGTHTRQTVKPSDMSSLRAIAAWLTRHSARRPKSSGIGEVKRAESFPDEMAQERNIKGMRPAKIMAPIFAANDPRHVLMSRDMLRGGVIGVMLQNIAWLRAYPQTPMLYNADVIYKPEKRKEGSGRVIEYGEEWQTIPWVLYRGYGDCEDLGAWRAAELNQRFGIRALPWIKVRRMPNGFWRAHVVVKWPNGQIEDPSAKLGMYEYANR